MAARRYRNKHGRFISAATYRRSLAASRAWRERRAREAAEHQRRSNAAKRAWKVRREKEKGTRRAGREMAQAERRRQEIHGPVAEVEYVRAIKYRSPRGRQHFGTVQASIFAPPNTPKKELEESVYQSLTTNASRFRVRIIEWKRRR